MSITIETTVTAPELAVVLGVSGRRISQLVEDGIIQKAGRGKYNLADCVRQYVEFKSVPLPDEEELAVIRRKADADTRLKIAKAEMAELEAEEIKGNMHRSEDVAAMTEDLVYSMREALIALPGRLAVDAAAAKTPAEASDVIKREVYNLMRELAKHRYDPKVYEERVRDRLDWTAEDIDWPEDDE